MTLQQLIEEQLQDYETRSYSGRGMYGKQCLGVVTENPLRFMLELGEEIGHFNETTYDNIPLPNNIEQDSMGHHAIVYFPNIPYNHEGE